MAEFVRMKDKTTGDIVWFPETHLELFPKLLEKLPSQKAAEAAADTTKKEAK